MISTQKYIFLSKRNLINYRISDFVYIGLNKLFLETVYFYNEIFPMKLEPVLLAKFFITKVYLKNPQYYT